MVKVIELECVEVIIRCLVYCFNHGFIQKRNFCLYLQNILYAPLFTLLYVTRESNISDYRVFKVVSGTAS